jgi:MarR family transcriptional regulator, transcriptional regulator for hemolysin
MAVRLESREEASETSQTLSRNLSWMLKQASYALSTELVAALAPLKVSPRAYHVLAVAQTGEHTQTELAQLVGLDKTTMVVTIDELEEAGLAKRLPSSQDRRARVITVTKAGQRKVAEGRKIMARVEDEVLATLPPGERTGLLDALNRLVSDRLSEPVQCTPPVRRREPR